MMHHRCCSSGNTHQGHLCTCAMFHGQAATNSFSMLFSMPNHNHNNNPYDQPDDDIIYSSSSSSSSVDCTLSLGTPSTRFTQDEHNRTRHERRSSVSNFCWDLLHSTKSQSKSSSSNRTSNNNNTDPLVARRCANCDTTSTPLWRNGPRGPKSLCNACGIRYKKEERRASAAAAASGAVMESPQIYNSNSSSWYPHSQSQKMAMGGEFRFVDDGDVRESENGIPFLSWRINVTDRTSMVHDFTR
ncbi:hypothetical protein PIB30_007174 [Stylosanthes scabra]|uniref:GATA-type domain-containing protein n=1 Tax=Stylosanthes scabra TaxID=79078 RepID=A0ABU6U6B4_9FABA|nr:hypothetical protein [Stylosanthes scabra]